MKKILYLLLFIPFTSNGQSFEKHSNSAIFYKYVYIYDSLRVPLIELPNTSSLPVTYNKPALGTRNDSLFFWNTSTWSIIGKFYYANTYILQSGDTFKLDTASFISLIKSLISDSLQKALLKNDTTNLVPGEQQFLDSLSNHRTAINTKLSTSIASSNYIPYNSAYKAIDLNGKDIKNFHISKTTDTTAQLIIDVSNIPASTIRTATMPNRSVKWDSVTTSTTTAITGFLKNGGSNTIVGDATVVTDAGTFGANQIVVANGTGHQAASSASLTYLAPALINNSTTPTFNAKTTGTSSYGGIIFAEGNTNVGFIQYLGSTYSTTPYRNNIRINNVQNAPMEFWTNNIARCRIQGDGSFELYGTLPFRIGGTGTGTDYVGQYGNDGTSCFFQPRVDGTAAWQLRNSVGTPYFTGNSSSGTVTIAGHPTIEGQTLTGVTGSGKLVLDNTPTFITPNLGTAIATNVYKGTSSVSDSIYQTMKWIKQYVATQTNGLADLRGNYDASVNVFPSIGGSGGGGAVVKGDYWNITVAGTLGGVAVTSGYSIAALVDAPGQTLGNWNIFSGPVTMPVGRTSGDVNTGFVNYSGTTATAGQFFGGSGSASSSTTRLSYNGPFYAYRFQARSDIRADAGAASYALMNTLGFETNGTLNAFQNGVGTTNVTLDYDYGVKLNGNTTVWTNMKWSAQNLKLTGSAVNKPDFDNTEIGLLFPDNDTTENVGLSDILISSWKESSSIYPKVFYVQGTADSARWLMKYRIYNKGAAIPSTWTIVESNNHLQTWSSGNIVQVATFAPITMTSKTIGCTIDAIIYRNPADAITGDVLLKSFAIGLELDVIGSRTVNSK